jgi:hypothetical protein
MISENYDLRPEGRYSLKKHTHSDIDYSRDSQLIDKLGTSALLQ